MALFCYITGLLTLSLKSSDCHSCFCIVIFFLVVHLGHGFGHRVVLILLKKSAFVIGVELIK